MRNPSTAPTRSSRCRAARARSRSSRSPTRWPPRRSVCGASASDCAADPRYNSWPIGCWSYLLRSRYAEQVERWFELFPREQFLFLKTEDLESHAAGDARQRVRVSRPAPLCERAAAASACLTALRARYRRRSGRNSRSTSGRTTSGSTGSSASTSAGTASGWRGRSSSPGPPGESVGPPRRPSPRPARICSCSTSAQTSTAAHIRSRRGTISSRRRRTVAPRRARRGSRSGRRPEAGRRSRLP